MQLSRNGGKNYLNQCKTAKLRPLLFHNVSWSIIFKELLGILSSQSVRRFHISLTTPTWLLNQWKTWIDLWETGSFHHLRTLYLWQQDGKHHITVALSACVCVCVCSDVYSRFCLIFSNNKTETQCSFNAEIAKKHSCKARLLWNVPVFHVCFCWVSSVCFVRVDRLLDD